MGPFLTRLRCHLVSHPSTRTWRQTSCIAPKTTRNTSTTTTNTSDHNRRYIYPAETTRHIATILGFPSKHSIAPAYYEDACKEIANLATTISAFEPVRLYARPEDTSKAQSLIHRDIATNNTTSNVSDIAIIPFPTNHLWVRDTGPVYVRGFNKEDAHKRFAIDFHFSEWGKRDRASGRRRAPDGHDWPVMNGVRIRENAEFAGRVVEADADPAAVTRVVAKIRLEGGALVADGDGTLLATASSIVNDNRNPGITKTEIVPELRRLLGVEKVIWFPGRNGLDVTDVHIDGEVNFVRPGVVVISRPHTRASKNWWRVHERIRKNLLRTSDAKGRRFRVHLLDEPDPAVFGPLSPQNAAANYVNFYFVNGGLIVPQFGDARTDREALDTLQRLCPDRLVRGVQVRALPMAGGVIHCATQPVIEIGI